jgi:hypothetical protein
MPKRSSEIQREIRELKADMKDRGIRVASFMNGGQTLEGMRCNERLFELKLKKEAALKAAPSQGVHHRAVVNRSKRHD